MSYIDKLFSVEGRVVVLTGAAGFLCGKMARAFGHSGAKVVILDTNEEGCKKVVDDIVRDGGIASYYVCNSAIKKDLVDVMEKIIQEYGFLDGVINGAGINAPTPFFDITEEEWDKILAVHIKGTLFSCQVFGSHMVSRGKGSIINISSASAGPPLSKAFAYSVAKAGIKNLTQNVAREFAVSGVRVNALRPGFFPTEWSKKNFITPERDTAILNHTPMRRYGDPEELVGAVIWLMSDASRFVTGAEITVDGGFSAMTI